MTIDDAHVRRSLRRAFSADPELFGPEIINIDDVRGDLVVNLANGQTISFEWLIDGDARTGKPSGGNVEVAHGEEEGPWI